MIDSKNFLWLGAFFTLLFITFCVSTHLDELNPKFITETKDSFNAKSEKTIDTIKDEDKSYVNSIDIVDLTDKNNTAKKINTHNKKDKYDKNISEETTKVRFDKTDEINLTNSFIFKKPDDNKTVKNNSKNDKNQSLKSKINKNKKIIKKSKTKKSSKARKLEMIFLQDKQIRILLDGDSISVVNRFIAKLKNKKNAFVLIKNRDKKILNDIKNILIKKGISKNKIKIKIDQNKKLILELYKRN